MILPRGWSRRWLALITLILFGAFALRLWNLGTQSLWHDEAWSVMSAYQPLNPIDPNYPPLFTVLLGVWIRLAGDSVWAMRYWTLLFAVPTVAVVAMLVRRWFGSRAAALAALLTAASPSLWVYSQEIRSYVLIPLLIVPLLGLVDALLNGQNRAGHRPAPTGDSPLNRERRRVWIWLALVEIIMLYSHNLAVPVVAWLNVTVGVVLLFRREWRRLGSWIAVQIGLLILYLPWLITQKPTGTPLNTPPQVSLALMGQIWQSYFTGIKALVGADPALIALVTVIGAVLAVSLIALVVYRRSQRTWLLISQAFLVPLFELIIILAAHIDFHPRYFLAGVPAALMVIAAGIDTLARELLIRRPVINGLVWAAATALVLITIGRMVTVVYSSPIYQHDDFRGIAEHYAQLGPDDAIIIPYGYEPTLEYYSRKMNFKAKMIGIPLHSSAETVKESLEKELKYIKTAEVLTWYQLPADPRGEYSCLLGAVRPHVGTLTVSGLQTNTYGISTSPFIKETGNDNSIDYHFIQLLNDEVVSGAYGSCMITSWQLQIPSTTNWRIRAEVLNHLGWFLSQSDTDLLSDNELPTSLWSQNQIGTVFNLLRLPDDVPASPFYQVGVEVYASDTLSDIPVFMHGNATYMTGQFVDRIYAPPASPVPSQPDKGDINLGTALYLHHADLPTGVLQPGQYIRLTLDLWQTALVSSFQSTTITLQGKDWQVSGHEYLFSQGKQLTWYQLLVPAAASGQAKLIVTAPDGQSTTIAQYDIAPISHVFTAPPTVHPASADFVGLGTLVGADATQTIKHGDPINVSLIWKVDATPDTASTVFVHLLDSSGQVIAQNDSPPVQGNRPTTSWLEGEYITDAHTLTWNRADYTGPATLEVGLYDPTTQQRVKLADGSDHFVLPFTVTVQ